jgi:large subunit ribosomal protein L3
MSFCFAKKYGMSQMYGSEGKMNPVTVLNCAKDGKVLGILTLEKNGYSAIKVGAFFDKQDKPKVLKEFRVKDSNSFSVGQAILIDEICEGDKLQVEGRTKGKGFEGVMKRHGFHGAKATHGTKHNHRAPGSIGAGYPEHVLKGKRMAGRGGFDNKTIKNVKVLKVDIENGLLYVKGCLQGPNKGLLKISKISK